MTTADRILELRRHGLPHGVIAAILGVDEVEVVANEADPGSASQRDKLYVQNDGTGAPSTWLTCALDDESVAEDGYVDAEVGTGHERTAGGLIVSEGIWYVKLMSFLGGSGNATSLVLSIHTDDGSDNTLPALTQGFPVPGQAPEVVLTGRFPEGSLIVPRVSQNGSAGRALTYRFTAVKLA